MSAKHSPSELANQLQTLSFFAGLPELTLTELVQTAVRRTYDPGEIIFLEGEQATGLYFLQTGWVKIVKSNPAGREQVLRFMEPGDTFNEIVVFANQPNPATAIALETANVWLLPRQALNHALRQNPDFAQHAIAKMAERVLHLVTLVADLSLRPVTGRLARLISDGAVGGVLSRPRWYTQSELAARLGTVPDVVQRALRQLEQDGLIQVERHQIHILDAAALADIAT
ncbi:Crp/Fnr family transcriptional regulator [Candidatus Leptofilum sp.]|uniref:Crp/Fnr family transcriptional regulator n=1 Tax=Candidatus Leptofilum sp. TaxID=3241576 RepID=UPI003B5BFA82